LIMRSLVRCDVMPMPLKSEFVILVLRQGSIDGFSWPVSVHGKARLEALESLIH